MLVQITKQRDAATRENAIDSLLECHERIRYFMRMAHGVVSGKASDAEIADAAGEVHRYFTVALPLHSADEDDSLMPRVHAGSCDLSNALLRMEEQHAEIEEILRQLRPIWNEISLDPARSKHNSDLEALTTRLQTLWDDHLAMEEEFIFPAASQLLTPADHESIRAEMRQRRE